MGARTQRISQRSGACRPGSARRAPPPAALVEAIAQASSAFVLGRGSTFAHRRRGGAEAEGDLRAARRGVLGRRGDARAGGDRAARLSRAGVSAAATKRRQGSPRRWRVSARSARASSSSRRAPRTARIGSAPKTPAIRCWRRSRWSIASMRWPRRRRGRSGAIPTGRAICARSRRRADADICRRAAVRRRSISRRLPRW